MPVTASDQLNGTEMGKDNTGLASQPPLLSMPAFSDVRREQWARRVLLDEACASHRQQGEGPRRLLTASDLRHLVVDDRHGLLYCYVPKVACTNWKRVLLVLAGQAAQPLDIPAGRAHAVGAFRTLDSFAPAEINRRLRTYLKFLFVREPFERLVSAYRNKFTRAYNTAFHRRYGTRIIRRHRRRPSARALRHGADVTFAEFVWYLTDPRTRRDGPFNEHWDTIHSLCHPCLIRYDVLGRYETLERDAHYLLSLASPQHPVTFPRSSRSVTTTGVAAAYFRNVSPFYQRKLFQLYRLDFALFNYSVPAYLNMG
ncbi:carbohydrate sulfotransferase 13 [Amblyraja radiata]|uniref:carbohydrate sulfotransferase 13 n=1 Tax=Amblyraja radiata TaxID=386614 RepID=UPI001403E29F|nr:carbohydrate sulfotransferase 13 [Amblyraja radiata]